MSLDRQQLEADILQFVKARAPGYPSLGLDTDLLEEGVLDSLLLMDTIFHLEEKYGLKLGSEHIDPTNFRSPAAIVDLVIGQTGGRSTAA